MSSSRIAKRLLDDADEAQLAAIVAGMSIKSKVGQIFQPNWVNFRAAAGGIPLLTGRGILPSNLVTRHPRPLRDEDVSDVFREHGFGSVLGDGGSAPEPNVPSAWRVQAEALQRAAAQAPAGVPLLIGNDSVHGQNNLKDSTILPHHINQGCLRDGAGAPDTDLVRELARVSARESAACGINWLFSPCVAVPHDLRWGRTYEGFSEDAATVGVLGAAEVSGIQEAGVPMAACVKHFVADGGTEYGTGTWLFFWSGAPTNVCDHGDCACDEPKLRADHLAAYAPALAAGVHTVMASYSSVGGVKMHAHRRLLTTVLKEELGFDGLVVSDYNAINHIASKHGGFGKCVCACLEAGIDMVMTAGGLIGFGGDMPYEAQLAAVVGAVESGQLSAARLDDAVTRVLRVKMASGALPRASGVCVPPPPAPEAMLALDKSVGCAAHRAIARRAVRGSCVLLKNERDALPLHANTCGHDGTGGGAGVVVTGRGAHDLGMQCGGWTLSWMGQRGNGFTNGTTIWEGLIKRLPRATLIGSDSAKLGARLAWWTYGMSWPTNLEFAQTVVLVVGEPPYAEGGGDTREARLPQRDVGLIDALADGVKKLVVVLVCGRPLVIPPATLDRIDALLVCWLPGTEGDGVADVMVGACQTTGRLSYSWPRDRTQMRKADRQGESALFPRGFGLEYAAAAVKAEPVPEQAPHELV